jgi:hypothetical protein
MAFSTQYKNMLIAEDALRLIRGLSEITRQELARLLSERPELLGDEYVVVSKKVLERFLGNTESIFKRLMESNRKYAEQGREMTPFEAAVLRLREEIQPNGKCLSFGTIASKLNAKGLKGRKRHSYNSVKAAYHRAISKQ